jgi:hypothetical protein
MNFIYPDCGAYHWSVESLSQTGPGGVLHFGIYCFSGKVSPGHLQDIPIELHHLYFGMNDLAKQFQKNIRTYKHSYL